MPYPFERANALGFAMFENFTSAQATIIDANAAEGADGSIWTDVSLLANMHLETDIDGSHASTPTLGACSIWEPTQGRWINFGHNAAGNSTAWSSFGGTFGVWSQLTLDSDTVATTNWTSSRYADTDGNGVIVLGGNTNAANKIRRSADGGDTWTVQSVNEASSSAVDVIKWMPSANLFVAGLNTTSVNNIETSPDGITWTVRTAPNTNARRDAAANAVRMVVLTGVSTNKVITSEDGITWTERTLPATTTWASVAWNERAGLFMAVGGTNIATSPDGITWTTVTPTTLPVSITNRVRAFGRIWVAHSGVIQISTDNGITWKIYGSATSGTRAMESSGQQMLWVTATPDNRVIRTLFGGV